MTGIQVSAAGRILTIVPATGVSSLTAPEALSDLGALCEELAYEERVLVLLVETGEPRDGALGHDAVRVLEALWRTPHVTIAVLERDCLDSEFGLALACDLRVARAGLRIGFPGAAAGVAPSAPTVRWLASITGRSRAADLLFTGRTIDAAAAAEWGIAELADESETAQAHAGALAQRICDGAPLAMRYAKEAVDRGYGLSLQDGLALEGDLYAILQTTNDRREGIEAFHARRKPRYIGA